MRGGLTSGAVGGRPGGPALDEELLGRRHKPRLDLGAIALEPRLENVAKKRRR